MPTVNETADFFVVGGALRAEQACYVVRDADRELLTAVREGQLCCVLGPPGVGKSSLAVRAAAELRRGGARAALVTADIVEAAATRESVADGLRTLALAVGRELGIEAAAAKWWQAQPDAGAAEDFAAFLRSVALAASATPLAVLIDGIEALIDTPLGTEVLAAIALCVERKDKDAGYARLAFVVLGRASRRKLVGRDPGSPFAAAAAVSVGDFSTDEAYRLAAGFGGGREQEQALMDRVCVWTGGHPYFTQKVARGVARKGGRLEDVERVVREQLLAPGAVEADALLAQLRADLFARTPSARRAARLLRKAARGAKVTAPSDSKVLEELYLSGAAAVAERKLEPRNRIVRELAAAGVFERSRRAWKFAAAAAVAALAVAGGAFWYTQYLPQADLATLTAADADIEDLGESHERLRQLPGFAERADELFVAALTRASVSAATLAEARAVDERLRALPGRVELADGLLGDYWLRRALDAANAERRDAAVLFANRAAAVPGVSGRTADAYLRELVGSDYPSLERSLRLAEAPAAWRMLFDQQAVVFVDAQRQISRVPFGAATDDLTAPPQRLTALAPAALQRDLTVEGEGSAGDLELTLVLEHPAGGELLVTLTAPSGAQATVGVPASSSAALETFVFPAVPGAALAPLADEAQRGVWRLTIVDRSANNSGVLAAWRLRFGDDVWDDAPGVPLYIPDPERTDAVSVSLERNFALARPQRVGTAGSVALWDLATQRLANDFVFSSAPSSVAVSPDGQRLAVVTANVVTVFDASTGSPAARVATDTEFVLPPVFSPDSAYFAIAERVEGGVPLFSVLRAADASLVASFEGTADATGWQLGPGGRWVAATGARDVVTVLDGRGGVVARLVPPREFVQVVALGDGTRILTVDVGGEIAVVSLADGASRRLGSTFSPASVSVSADGARVAYVDEGGAAVVATATGAVVARVRHESSARLRGAQLDASGTALVTAGADTLRLWRVPAAAAATTTEASVARASAFALARGGERVVIGFESGQIEFVEAGDIGRVGARQRNAVAGHQGSVTAATLAAAGAVAATGGADGTVRIWDVASAAPVGVVMQPTTAPISHVALSADGRWIASAAARIVRVASTADGRVVREFPPGAAIEALVFSPDGAALAVGDAVGRVMLIGVEDGRRVFDVRLDAGIGALAFGADVLAVGDAAGGVRLLRLGDGEASAPPLRLPQGVRWLDWSAGGALLAATRDWLHVLRTTERGLVSTHARFAPRPVPTAALAAVGDTTIRLVGPDSRGVLGVAVVDVTALPAASEGPLFEARDWPAALGWRLDDAGEPVPYEP